MKRILLAAAISAALLGPAVAVAADITQTPLISRDALFGNPERSGVQISPDGDYLSWVAPLNGVMNIWVAPANDPSKARAVTADTARGIRTCNLPGHPLK